MPDEGAIQKGRIEIYTRSRWATVTGQHVEGTPVDLEDRTDELLSLHREIFRVVEVPLPPAAAPNAISPLSDTELLHLAQTARNGRRFHELYYGPVPPGDHSRLDFELVAKLMFWAGHDFDRVDRLFRQSALMRSKWLRADYRIRTLRSASSRVTEHHSPSLTVKEQKHATG
jgi:primase-polymerase (primpol)-like protein